jgi:curved DNA-binding protein CbpA
MSAPVASFVDHYQVLGLEMTASAEEITSAYQTLAARYQPSNKATADPQKFAALNASYQVLADPEAKAVFDGLRGGGQKEEKIAPFNPEQFFTGLSVDSHRRLCLLSVLYNRRCQTPRTPAIPYRLIERMVKITNEQLTMAVWFLKEKGYVTADDKSALMITVPGIEYLERSGVTPEMILPYLHAAEEKPAELPVEPAKPVISAEENPAAESVLSKLKINLPQRTTDGSSIRIPRPMQRPKAPPAM